MLGLAWWFGAPTLALIGAILLAHTGIDRLAGYGLKYPGAFGETHLGRLERATDKPAVGASAVLLIESTMVSLLRLGLPRAVRTSCGPRYCWLTGVMPT
jgi:hypothetical protein